MLYYILFAVLFIGIFFRKLRKIYVALTFFSKSYIKGNFRSIRTLGWPYRTAKNGIVAEFNKVEFKDLPEKFSFKGENYNSKKWIASHQVTGLVVLKIDSVTKANLVYESYYLGNNANTKTISWSINKSIVSALVGIAITEGKIASIEDEVVEYVPMLVNSGYDGVKIKHVLQMTSGISFNEDYSNTFSDINCMAYTLAMGYDIDTCISALDTCNKPGVMFDYVSSDTQVLGMILKKAIGEQSLTSYLEEKLWSRGGFESECDWLIDNDKNKMELAFGTLNATTRDYARFGWLYANMGLSPVDGVQLIDSEWIDKSTKCIESHLFPSYPNKLGYGYQWWIPGNKGEELRGDYLAIGVYGQFIYVDPINNIVIAMNSANYNYTSEVDMYGVNVGELEAVELFRAMSDHYSM